MYTQFSLPLRTPPPTHQQIIGNLAKGVSNTLTQPSTTINPITGDPANQGAIGVGALVSALTNPQAAVGNVVGVRFFSP